MDGVQKLIWVIFVVCVCDAIHYSTNIYQVVIGTQIVRGKHQGKVQKHT